MAVPAGNTTQMMLYNQVLAGLGKLGFHGPLLKHGYRFTDYFAGPNEQRTVDLAAFGRTPVGYDTACFSVSVANGKSGPPLVADCRSLGAPMAFEVTPSGVNLWRVSARPGADDLISSHTANSLSHLFDHNAEWWKPRSLLRLKDARRVSAVQHDFIDYGLLPALENNIRAKLGPLLQNLLVDVRDGEKRHGGNAAVDEDAIVALVFRVLAGKVLHDRSEPPFAAFADEPDAEMLLRLVADHYKDYREIPLHPAVKQLAVHELWKAFSFRNLSVEVLAYIWENTLVTDRLRGADGIHTTPFPVAQYMVQRLPFASFSHDQRTVLESCSGNGTFLIAALHRLLELSPPAYDERLRHKYLKKMLRGHEKSAFGNEVARTCLMLADFPNPNGWKLFKTDVFDQSQGKEYRKYVRDIGRSSVVLCNPPFEAFTEEEKATYKPQHSTKAAEVLSVVLRHMKPDAVLGFILPVKFLDGRDHKKIRGMLAARFGKLEIVQLPEGIFEHAQVQAAILLASRPSTEPLQRTAITYSAVDEDAVERFLSTGEVSRTDQFVASRASIEEGIRAPQLGVVWSALTESSRLKDAAKTLSRGVEWENFDAATFVSEQGKRGYLPGYHVSAKLNAFQPPPLRFLQGDARYRRRNAWHLPWKEPKVVINAIRKARTGPWRLAAATVTLNVLASQNFYVLWPLAPWTPNAIAAVLNGPVASAYVATHELGKHVTKPTLNGIPLPQLTNQQIAKLDKLVAKYTSTAISNEEHGEAAGMFGGMKIVGRMRKLLAEIDYIVLSGYGLPASALQALYKFFDGHDRLAPIPAGIDAVKYAMEHSGQLPGDVIDQVDDRELLRRELRIGRPDDEVALP